MAQSKAQGERNEIQNRSKYSSSEQATHAQVRNSTSSQMAADYPLPDNSSRVDRGSHQMGGVTDESQNQTRPPLYGRVTRVSAVSGANFRVAKSVGLGNRNRKIGVDGEVITPSITPELPLLETVENTEDGSGGNFRFELEFLEQKSGVVVKIRERTRFTIDGKRPSFILGVFACGQINKRQLKALRAKTLPPGVKTALAEGDISYAVLEELFKRPGKGATAEARKAGQRFRQAQTKHNG